MKFVPTAPFADPDVTARKLVEITSTIEPVQNGRIVIELVNAPFLKTGGAVRAITGPASTARSSKAGSRGTRAASTCGFTEAGAALFA